MRTDRMFRVIAALACLVLGAASITSAAMAGPLDNLLGQKNAILLFAKSRSDASIDRQLSLFQERRPELDERDAVVITVLGDRDAIAAVGYVTLPAGASRDLRKQFAPNPVGMTAVLVGKDGREMGRWSHIVQPDELLDLIDSAPDARDEAGAIQSAG